MADNVVKIKFTGEGDLLKKIERLDKATKSLIGTQSRLIAEGKKVSNVQKNITKNTNKLTAAQKKQTQRTRILGGSFAVIRSKLLLFNFAMALGIRQLIDFTKSSSRLDSMRASFDSLSRGAMDSQKTLENLKNATNNTMSEFDLLQQANNALVLGVAKTSAEMSEMYDIAQRLGRALGRDTTSSVESLITGIGRQSRLMLDNIGIIVKTKDAYALYAKELNKTVDSLTETEQKQAFLNATLESARQKVALVGEETANAQSVFEKLSASLDNTGAIIGNALTPLMVSLAKAMTSLSNSFALATNKLFGLEIAEKRQLTLLRELSSAMQNNIIELKNRDKIITASIINIQKTAENALEKEQKAVKSLISSLDLLSKTREEQIIIREQEQLRERIFREFTKGMSNDQIKRHKNTINALVQMKVVQETAHKIEKDQSNEKVKFIKKRIDMLTTLLEKQKELDDSRREQAQKTKIEEIDASREVLQEKINAIKKEIEERKLLEEARMTSNNVLLDSFRSFTGEVNSLIDQRVQNDLQALRQTEVFQDASAEKRQNLENQVLAKHSKTQFAMFMVNKAVKLADIAMATASGIATVSALPPLFTANPMIAFLKAMGLAQAGIVMATPPPPTFETGGLVGGRRHSQGGTLIEAERGEFVMSRNAVQSLGVETMNQINQGNAGGITLNISAPLVDETILDTIIPAIQKAQRNNLA